ncbi:MAG: GNAT family N-acetyltransferase [Flavobacteriaceae bacterium]|nr:GNAT family N-acetyltransferase [Flavobacteriaceae bacterium]
MIFETKRMLIRILSDHDIDAFYDMVGDPDVMKFIKPVLSYTESKNELKRFIQYSKDSTKEFNIWAVTDKQIDEMIGLCGYYLNEFKEYEIAYRLRKTFWKKGFGTEMLQGLLSYLQNVIYRDSLVAYVSKENEASIALLEKRMLRCENDKENALNYEYKYILTNDQR